MANLSTDSSGYQTGATDTWTSVVNNVTEHRAEHINGPVSAILQIESVLGSGSSLPGTQASLAARLAVQVGSDGIIIPVGAIFPYAGSSAPTGWLFCDGSAVSRTTYSTLFTTLGTSYGSGDGSTTFNVPDLRGRGLVGAGAGTGGGDTGTGKPTGGDALTARSVGQWGGEETHLLTGAESGTSAHDHESNISVGKSNDGADQVFRSGDSTAGTAWNFTVSASTEADADEAHNTMPPFVVCNFIIKA